MADLTALQARLAEAEAARHQAAIGGAIKEIWRDGRRLTYSSTDIGALDSYIEDLNRQILIAQDAVNGTCISKRRAIGVIFR